MRWLAALLMLALLPCRAPHAEDATCGVAVAAAEERFDIPSGLLQAIALSESGRWDRQARSTVAWPWAVTSGTESYFPPDKQAAIATVERLRRQGRRNIDVGCMQVNLMHHPDAFEGLDSAFDPALNAEYGARFLAGLRQATRSWARAVERYHSADPERGRGYRDRVYDRWRTARGGESPAIARMPQPPTVARPSRPEPAPRSAGLFASAGPRWKLAPVRIGPSLWTFRSAMPLVVRGPATATRSADRPQPGAPRRTPKVADD